MPSEGLFYITAQAASRPPRVLKYGDGSWSSMAAATSRPPGPLRGPVPSTRAIFRTSNCWSTGYSRYCSAPICANNPAFFVDLTNPDFLAGQRLILEKDTVHILRAIFLCHEEYGLSAVRRARSTAIAPSTCSSRFCSGSDFADLFEVRGSRRERRGTATAKVRSDDQVLLIYHGLDNKVRHTTVNFDPPQNRLATNAATYDLRLAPKETRPLFLAVSCDRTNSRPPPFLRGRLAARRELRAATRNQTSRSKTRTTISTRCYAGPQPTSPCS